MHEVIKIKSHAAYRRERRALQCAITIAALVPISAGALGMLIGARAFDPAMTLDTPSAITLDSHVRYLSGLLLGLGITFWWMAPHIERHTTPVRVLTCMVFIGGLARLSAYFTLGAPSLPMQLAIGMELVVTPLLCLWQTRIARLARSL
ncbi:MAG: DUF4345 domain-containing protein [Rickettsiales bacterium]|nr:DUF4345 domain-containing protein [Rickettsiales bacterium]